MDYVVLVDEQDNVIGTAEKLTVHRLGLLHRAFSVVIYRLENGEPEILLQQRQDNKYHSAGLWSNACCSHPNLNEALLAAGQRRLQEELNVIVALNYAGFFKYHAQFQNGLVEHEIDHVLVGRYEPEVGDAISPNPAEVKAVAWIKLQDLQEELKVNTTKFTAWFEEALNMALPIINNSTTSLA